MIEHRGEDTVVESITTDLSKAFITLHLFRMMSAVKGRGESATLYREGRHEAEFDFVREMFGIHSEGVTNGFVSLLHNAARLIHSMGGHCYSIDTSAIIRYPAL